MASLPWIAINPAFSPDELSGQKAWYDFADVSTLFTDSSRTTPVSADGHEIRGVTDKSGTGNHLTDSLGAPTYRPSVLNSLSVSRFVAGDATTGSKLVVPNAFGALTSATIFLVQKAALDPASPASEGAAISGWGSDLFQDHFPYQTGDVYWGWASNGRKATGNPSASLASWHCVTAHSAANDWSLSINGSVHYSTVSNSVAWGTAPRLGYKVYSFTGDVAEIIMYDSVLSSIAKGLIHSYISRKWGITIA